MRKSQPAVPVRPAPYEVERKRYTGVAGTVKHMVTFIRDGQTRGEVRDYALDTIKNVYPHATTSEIAALYFDLCRRLRYTRDPANAEMLHQPQITLQNRAGDCDDMAVALGAATQAAVGKRLQYQGSAGVAAASVGAPVEVVTVGFTGPKGEHTHTFVRTWDSQTAQWLVMDPVAGPLTSNMIRRVTNYKTWSV